MEDMTGETTLPVDELPSGPAGGGGGYVSPNTTVYLPADTVVGPSTDAEPAGTQVITTTTPIVNGSKQLDYVPTGTRLSLSATRAARQATSTAVVSTPKPIVTINDFMAGGVVSTPGSTGIPGISSPASQGAPIKLGFNLAGMSTMTVLGIAGLGLGAYLLYKIVKK